MVFKYIQINTSQELLIKILYLFYSAMTRAICISGEGDDYMGRAFLTASVSTSYKLYGYLFMHLIVNR